MSVLPDIFIKRMQLRLGAEAVAFFEALQQSPPASIRLHHRKGQCPYALQEKVPWCETGYYLRERPAFHLDPHWHGGAYYVQEASSMILDHVLAQLITDARPRIWLDLCAAPGGKTGILAKHMRPADILIANEVVSQRRSVLYENLIKGGYRNTCITGLAASAFSVPLADVLLIDAPCAGEGMMRKEPEAIAQWSPALVKSCAIMQRKIIAQSITCLRPGGYLVYSTCSYSDDENIGNVNHFLNTYDLHPVQVSFPRDWDIVTLQEDEATGYQLYPHKVKGEGLFIAVLQRREENAPAGFSIKQSTSLFSPVPGNIGSHIRHAENYVTLKNDPAYPLITREAEEKAAEAMQRLPAAQWITGAGEVKGSDFIPSHFLAMAGLESQTCAVIDLEHEQALDYLERDTRSLPQGLAPGWHLVRYEQTALGWAKLTPQGWRNYFPLPWRLRKR